MLLPDPEALASMSDSDREHLIKRLKKMQKQQERESKVCDERDGMGDAQPLS